MSTDGTDRRRRMVVVSGLVLLTWSPMLVAFLAFRPGIMTADSLVAWGDAQQGEVTDFSSALYSLVNVLAWEVAGTPSPIALLQSVFLAASIVAVARATVALGARRWMVVVIAAVLAASPMVGAFSMSLWKDIPYAACFLLVGAGTLRLVAAARAGQPAPTRQLALVAASLGAMVLLRQNGVLVAVPVIGALVLGLPGYRRHPFFAGAGAVVAALAIKAVVYPVAGVEPPPAWASTSTFNHDLAAVARYGPSEFDADDLAYVEAIGPLEVWAANYHCSTLDPLYYQSGLPLREEDFDTAGTMAVWLDVAPRAPLRIMRNRLCASAHAWRPDTTTPYVYTVSAGVDPNDLGVASVPVSDSVREVYLDALTWTNHPHRWWFLWRAPFWIYLAYAALAVLAVRVRRPLPLVLAAPLLGQQLGWLPFSPAQDARYMFPALMLAVLLLPVAAPHAAGLRAWARDEDAPPAGPDAE